MLKNFKSVLLVAMLSSIATLGYAEETAPVYDIDNYPPQFDGQSDPGLEQPSYASPQPLSLEKRVSRAEQQIVNLQRPDLLSKLDQLQSDLQSLRGEVDQLNHQLQDLQKQNTSHSSSDMQALHNQIEDLTQKLQQIESQLDKNINAKQLATTKPPANLTAIDDIDKANQSTKTVAQVKTKVAPAVQTADSTNSTDAVKSDTSKASDQPNVAEEQQIYQTAYDLIKAKKYNDAINALQKMLRKYPSGQFAANAHYWLGELYGLLGKNDQSASEFNNVIQNYPDSPKVSDAQLKLGIIYTAQLKWSSAKSAFRKVINRYPGTASARLASDQLKQLKAAGH